MQRPAILYFFPGAPECSSTVGACPNQGEELSAPPPGPYPRTFSVRIRRWNQRQWNHLFLLSWSGTGVKLEPAEHCPQWSGTERQPPPWTDELAEMSRHIYTRHGIGEALQKPVCQVGEKKYFNVVVMQNKGSSKTVMFELLPTHIRFCKWESVASSANLGSCSLMAKISFIGKEMIMDP